MKRWTWIALVMGWAFGASAPAAEASFGFTKPLGSPFAVGNDPTYTAVGDFNGDGHLDLISADKGAGTLTVLLGDGTGTFTPASWSPVSVGTSAAGPASLAVGDVNGDNIPDVAYALYDSGVLGVRQGDLTQGLVLTHAPLTVGTHPYSPQFGYFNDDRNLDLAVANAGDGTVQVFYGDGMGGFTAAPGAPINLGMGSTPWSIGVGDFNRDGKQDLAVSNLANGKVAIFLNDGHGGWTSPPGSPFSAGQSPYSIAVGDFNHDGKQDLAVANDVGGGIPGTVTVLLGDGSGGFAPAPGSPFPVGFNPTSVAAGDFNGDGSLDLVTANSTSNNATVLLGNGSGGFSEAPGSPFSTGDFTWSVAVGDFNGDHKPDFSVASQTSHDESVWINSSRAVRTLTSGTLAFGSQTVGTISSTRSVGLGTAADAPLDVSGATLGGPDAADFIIAQNTCTGLHVAVGAPDCSIAVRFAPTTTGAKSATLTVVDDSASQPAVIQLSGSGSTPASGGQPGTPPSIRVGPARANSAGVSDTITCQAATGKSCTTVETLTTTETVVGGRPVAVSARKRVRTTIVVGTKTVAIRAGHRATVVVTLNVRGRGLLARFHRLPVMLTISLKLNGRLETSRVRRTLTIRARKHR